MSDNNCSSFLEIFVYCGRDKKALDDLGTQYKFSQEHILPKSLIGVPKNNLFTIPNVCGVCNNLADRFIDAPAVKGWFMQMEMAKYEKEYAIITENTILPLRYMGKWKFQPNRPQKISLNRPH